MNINRKEIERQYNRIKKDGWLPWFQQAAKRADTSTAHFLAIGSRETNLRNIRGDFRNGRWNGFGVMQVDVGTDPNYAKNWTAQAVEPSIRRGGEIYSSKVDQIISGQGKRLTVRGHKFTGKRADTDDIRRMATAAYNSGLWPFYHFSRGEHVDSTTTGKDYSRDVYDRAIEFADLLEKDGTELSAVRREVELQGKYAKASAQKRAGVPETPDAHVDMGDEMEDQSVLIATDYRDDQDPEPISEGGPKTMPTTGGAQSVLPDTQAISVNTVTPAKESSIKRLWTALGLGGVGLGTFAGKIGGFFKEVDPMIIKIIIFVGFGALIIYLIGQFINGLFDRWTAFKLNQQQGQSAMTRTVNTIQFVPPETGEAKSTFGNGGK